MSDLEQSVGEMVSRALNGDQAAIDTLYRIYQQRLVGVAHRKLGNTLHGLMESVDLVQSVWSDILKDLDQFEDQGPDSFFRWLHACLIRKIHSKRRYHQAQKREAKRTSAWPEAGLAGPRGASDPTPSQNVSGLESTTSLQQALDRFPDLQRQVLILRMRDSLSFGEIGERVGRSEEATKKIYSRSLAKLIELLPSDLQP
ncbi:MAG: sigma-70 family RNA polymerase sigma factor [Planctomycetota bacterium]